MKSKNNSILSLQHSNVISNIETYNDGKKLKSLWLSIPAYCHLKCSYCFASTNDQGKKLDRLSNEQYERILRDFAKLGGEFVGIPGDGEPFHKMNWVLTKFISNICNELGLKLAIFTTGDAIFFEPEGDGNVIDYEKMDFLQDKNIVLLIKYNHSNEDVQNSLVGKEVDKVVKKKSKYSELRDKSIDILINKYHLNDVKRRLGLVTSIIKENAEREEENGKLEIVNIFERTKRDNLIFDCDTILELGRGRSFSKDCKVPPKIDLERVFNQLTEAGATGISQGGTYVGSTCCDRILHHLYIKANGDVFPCIGCSREDIEKTFLLGNVQYDSLESLWNKPLRRRLAEERFETIEGVCSHCENFQSELCYSCLGRCIPEFTEEDCKNFINQGYHSLSTIGCVHHKPITTTWLSGLVDYIRTMLSYTTTTDKLKFEGLEKLWRPNKNIAYTLWQLSPEDRRMVIEKIISHSGDPQDDISFNPQDKIIDSHIARFSIRKHYRYSELLFTMNRVWDFAKDPNLIEEVKTLDESDKKTLINTISQSFLSNIFLASFKILFEKYDTKDNSIQYCNFILYDNLREKYFYRSIAKDKSEFEDPFYFKSLIISRWYEDVKIDGKDTNFWKDYCFNLSAAFRHELYGDYELKLGTEEKISDNFNTELKRRTIDLIPIIENQSIKSKALLFDDVVSTKRFLGKYSLVEKFINSKIFSELESTDILLLKDLYSEINEKVFYDLDDKKYKELLDDIENQIDTLDNHSSVAERLMNEFKKSRKKGKGTKFINYFIYLSIMHNTLKVNYYYLLHSTNFKTINPEKQELMADSDLPGIIKSSGILICTKKPINNHFRSELKLFISSIFAPFDEFYYDQLYGKAKADKQFQDKVEAHRHTIINLINPLYPRIISNSTLKPYDKNGIIFALIAIYDICSKEEDRNKVGKLLPSNPKTILEELSAYFISAKNDSSATMELSSKLAESAKSLNPIERLDLFTVVFNLLDNAMKAGAQVGTKRVIQMSSIESEGLQVIIITNPRSMPNEVIHFLNDQDLNVHAYKFNTLIKETGGTVIIKKIVQKNKWLMSINSSEKQQKTVVTLTII